jgi:hypothetical protein
MARGEAAGWKLGRLLAKVERGKPGPAGKDRARCAPYLTLLEKIALVKKRAQERERIGAMPPGEAREGARRGPQGRFR